SKKRVYPSACRWEKAFFKRVWPGKKSVFRQREYMEVPSVCQCFSDKITAGYEVAGKVSTANESVVEWAAVCRHRTALFPGKARRVELCDGQAHQNQQAASAPVLRLIFCRVRPQRSF